MLAVHYRFSGLGERQSASASFRLDPTVSSADSIGAVRDLLAELHRRGRCCDPAAGGSVGPASVAVPTVRQTGTIAYALSGVVNQRAEAIQQEVFADVPNRPTGELNGLGALERTDDTRGIG